MTDCRKRFDRVEALGVCRVRKNDVLAVTVRQVAEEVEQIVIASLGLSANYTKNFPFSTYSVNLNWARNNKDAIRRFLAAYAKGVDWFYDRANRDEAISILIFYLKSDPKDVADTYDYFVKLPAFDRIGAVEGSGVENYLAILKRDGDLEGGTDLGRFYDPSLVH